jgi:ABC-type glycerol-3-phosphate transport system permease component
VALGRAEVASLPLERAATRPRSARRPRWAGRAALYLLAVATSALFMAPFLWTVFSSLKPSNELYTYPPTWLPSVVVWRNYPRVFEQVPYATWLLNTVLVASLATLGAVASSSLVAYSFARFRYPGRNVLFLLTLSTMMLPIEVTIIPLYIMFASVGWLDDFKPLIVPSFFGGSAFLIFLMRQFFMTIPLDLDEAARIDGAGPLTVFWAIMLPLSMPAVAAATVMTLIGHWESFVEPLIFLNSQSKLTLAVGLRYFSTQGDPSGEPMENLLMAATVMMTAPIIGLFFVSQRFFVRGIVMSGIKG